MSLGEEARDVRVDVEWHFLPRDLGPRFPALSAAGPDKAHHGNSVVRHVRFESLADVNRLLAATA